MQDGSGAAGCDGLAGGGAGRLGAAELRHGSAGRGVSDSRWRDDDCHAALCEKHNESGRFEIH